MGYLVFSSLLPFNDYIVKNTDAQYFVSILIISILTGQPINKFLFAYHDFCQVS
jgi:hypothetical protein